MKPVPPTGYLAAILQALDPSFARPGAATVVAVEHEPWCNRPDGQRCTCEPTFKFIPIGPDGKPTDEARA